MSARFPSATAVGIQFSCRLKNARFSISIAPLNVRPSENAASAPATTVVCPDVKAPRWKSSLTIGVASTASVTLAGISRKAICLRPSRTVPRKPSQSARTASRDSVGNSTVAIATEKIPCGSM